jgi:probable phosphoglycerate mutase
MILLVRHGQTAANATGLLQGRADLPLSEIGRAQAAALAGALAGCGARRVVSSPLQRALHTAAPIAAALEVDVALEPRLVELDYGDWDGRALTSVGVEEWARWRDDPEFAPPKGESLRAVRFRIDEWLDDERARDDTVVAVSHVSPIKAAIAVVVGAREASTWRMHLDVASVSRIGRRAGGLILLGYNEVVPYR